MQKSIQPEITSSRNSLFFSTLAVAGVLIAILLQKLNKPQSIIHQSKQHKKINNSKVLALIGDVGGTNIRYQLIQLTGLSYKKTKIIKQQKLKVTHFETLHQSIQHFLNGLPQYPQIAVIAIAGPVNNNTTLMSQVTKWGVLNGEEFKEKFKFKKFEFINDFQANAYALMELKDDDVVQIGYKKPVDFLPKMIIGPGTGLGTATLIKHRDQPPFVIPGQGGHRYFAPSTEEQQEYHDYFKIHNPNTIDISQALFCGPAIPLIYKFLVSKSSSSVPAEQLTSEQIICRGVNFPQSIYFKAVEFFLEMYQNSVGDQILMKLPYGGVYLQGSITSSILPLIQKKSYQFLQKYKSNRPYLSKILNKVPVVVVKNIELGLEGAFVYACKIRQQEF